MRIIVLGLGLLAIAVLVESPVVESSDTETATVESLLGPVDVADVVTPATPAPLFAESAEARLEQTTALANDSATASGHVPAVEPRARDPDTVSSNGLTNNHERTHAVFRPSPSWYPEV